MPSRKETPSPKVDDAEAPPDSLAARAKSAAGHAKEAVDEASDQAAALAAAAAKEIGDLRQTVESALEKAGVDTDALAEQAQAGLTTLERLLKEELEQRPLRTLAVAAAIGALFGALVLR